MPTDLNRGLSDAEIDARIHAGCKYCRGKMPTGNRHYCSLECRHLDAWVRRTCEHCSKPFEVRKCNTKGSGGRYCSTTCSSEGSSFRECRVFNGTRFYLAARSGYFVSSSGRRLSHAIWESANGPIPKRHLIHHRNGIKSDDRIENYELMEWGEHTREHHTGHGPRRKRATCHCGRPAIGQKLCSLHYQRQRKERLRATA